jgi:uncharacterized protein (TIGR02145 family)
MGYKDIPLTGIIRNLPDNTVIDGASQELINLRPRDGALRPVGRKVSSVSIPLDVRFIHLISYNIKVYIGVIADSLAYWVETTGDISEPITLDIPAADDMNFVPLYNTIMIGDNDLNISYVLLFDSDPKTYKILNGLPELPQMKIINHENGLNDSDIIPTPPVPEVVIPLAVAPTTQADPEAMQAEVLKLIADKNPVAVTGEVLLRFAWELMDESIVKHSLPVRASASYFKIRWDGDVCYLSWFGEAIVLTTTTSSADRTIIADTYKGLIKSLNVYMTSPMPPDQLPYYTPTAPLTLTGKKPSISEETNYYLIQKIPLANVPGAFTGTTFTILGTEYITDTLPGPFSDIETKQSMEVDNFSHHKIHGRSMFGYNSRIFLGSIVTKLYNGSNPVGMLDLWPDGVTGDPYEVGMEFDIDTANGTKTVFNGWGTCNYYKDGGVVPAFILNNNFGYPDYRAKIARLFVNHDGVIRLVRTLYLIQNIGMNFSTYSEGQEMSLIFTPMNYIDGPWDSYPIGALKTDADLYYLDPNRVQATELSNPLYFPAKNSYRVGSGEVLGMSSNVLALSQGQFGQFPIYTFCTDGIWTMNIGTGELLINTITPMARDVCNNPKSITAIDGGTVFSTTKGLYIVHGVTVTEISEPLRGNYLGRISGTLNYEAIANNPDLYLIKDFLCTADFITYISGAKIGWDYTMKEIIISNFSYRYSWVFSLKHKMWFKISEVFEHFVADFMQQDVSIDKITADRTDITGDDTTLTADVSAIITASIKGYPTTLGYRNDLNITSTLSKVSKMGVLYNWHSVNTGKLAPTGWDIPTNDEWNDFETFLGGDLVAGGKLKEAGIVNWADPNVGATDQYGFKALPGGYRNSDGKFYNIGESGTFWTATEYDATYAYAKAIFHQIESINNNYSNKKIGYSVRCINRYTMLAEGETGTVTDIDGNIYHTIRINGFEWMIENLMVSRLNDGTAIPEITDDTMWEELTDEGLCAYDNDMDNVFTETTIETAAPVYRRLELTNEDFTNLIPVHLETRPLKLASAAYKKINRMLIGGYINNNDGYLFSVNLFGSPDNINWYLLNNGLTFGSKTPLLINRSSFSCRYFILVIGGQVDEEAFFTNCEVDYEEKFKTKLR